METKYIQIRPDGIFTVTVECIEKHDAHEKRCYEYKFAVEARPTQNNFIDIFTAQLLRHGKRPSSFYAKRMGVDGRNFIATLTTLTGAGFREWTDTFAASVSEALLRSTTLTVGEIAAAAGWGFASGKTGIFSRWFTKRYKCSPSIWREAHKQDNPTA